MSRWFFGFPRSSLAVSAAAILLTGPVAAQEAEPTQDDRRCICIPESGASPRLQAFAAPRRAMLGVVLGEPTEVAGRSGIRLDEVREGAPADRAGLRDGDVVVALDGRGLGDDPTARLLEIMREVEPGDTVAVTFFRGDEERTARIETQRGSIFGAFGDGSVRMRAPGTRGAMMVPPRPPRMELGEVGRPAMLYRTLMMRGGLELTAVNPELGTYFGTDRGVLVADIEADSPLGLRPGDVILAIDGRDVEDPAHARAILASYREDENISFRIVREKRTIDVTGRHP